MGIVNTFPYEEAIISEEVTVTPSASQQIITPSSGKMISKATVNPIPSIYGDATNANAVAGSILNGEKAVVNNNGSASLITGTMPNIGTQTSVISSKNDVVSISAGKHNGNGTVKISDTEQAKIVAENLVGTILGVTGTAIPLSRAASETAVENKVLSGYTFIKQDGTLGTGTHSPIYIYTGTTATITLVITPSSGTVAFAEISDQSFYRIYHGYLIVNYLVDTTNFTIAINLDDNYIKEPFSIPYFPAPSLTFATNKTDWTITTSYRKVKVPIYAGTHSHMSSKTFTLVSWIIIST